jgi:hypothetical protein
MGHAQRWNSGVCSFSRRPFGFSTHAVVMRCATAAMTPAVMRCGSGELFAATIRGGCVAVQLAQKLRREHGQCVASKMVFSGAPGRTAGCPPAGHG